MYVAKNFKIYESVVIERTNSHLDGTKGKILSIVDEEYNFSPPPHHYIVGLDKFYMGNAAIYITEACIDRVGN